MDRIKLITLDLDDTLWPCWPTIKRAEEHLFDWLSEHAPLLTQRYDIEGFRTHRKDVAATQPEIAHDMTLVRLESLKLLMKQHGYDMVVAEQATQEFRQMRNRVEPYGEVGDALKRLATRYRLVSVTNGNSQVEQTPLKGCFDLSLSAADVGAQKPDPALFDAARAFAGAAPEETLHVGDHPQLDVEAARQAGLHTVWMDRGLISWPVEVAPADISVKDLGALADLLLLE